jgi:RNA polymerase sigma-70 factor, ECF subfamily
MRSEDCERLYDAHAHDLLAFLVYRVGNESLAEDLVADTFERVLRARRPFDPRKASEKTWLYTIALNCLRDHGRRQSAEGRALERMDTVDRGVDHNPGTERVEQRATLASALERLSSEEREAIALRYGADLTMPEIARVTRQRLSSVQGRIYRGLGKLREDLDA